uniref:Clc-like protein n=1 Tax=Syphacia muris TaxID=451379 RepID=A0A0N5AXT8_9BILA
MSAEDDSPSKCSRKTALILFFAAEILAFVFSLIALISPTWQYVNLENGRTEHHHGLWLDCKRDYSHEYGRNREFYETLNRLDIQQHPFDHFFLPSLDCVYKFDYYIDTEDLYDHNHDENRLQDDANQHLFLGWKIAALSAFGLAVLATGAALLLCICAFCHKTLICATTVLVCVATVLSSIGISVFYIWANYQDNNIIKEDDGIYEQYFGWAFYVQIVGTCLHFVASFLGCVATSIAFTRVKAKLVKIEVVDEDNSSLLDEESKRPFKRSFSAIYKVDSAALRQWEKDYMNKVKEGSFINKFKRTGSMPNIRRGERFQQRSKLGGQFKSSSQMFLDSCSSNPTLTTNTFDSTSERILSFTNTSEGANFKTVRNIHFSFCKVTNITARKYFSIYSSITNLTAASSNDENVRAFDRNDFSETNSVRSFLSANKLSEAPFEAVTKKQLTSNNISLICCRSFFNPEEIDRSVGSSAVLENDAVTDCSYNYLKEAELRLNLFMNDVTPLNKPDNLHSSNASKETNVTTV